MVDYLYNDLLPEERRKMDGHFKTCKHCARKLSQFQLIRTSFQQLKEQEPCSLVHQKVLADANDMDFQKRRSWLTQLLLRPSTATVIVVLIAIGTFYYIRQFTPLGIDTEKLITKAERVGESKEKIDNISTNKPLISEYSRGGKTIVSKPRPSATVSGGVSPEQIKALTKMVRTHPEDNTGGQEPLISSKDALYAFELGNLYFSQGEFEKAITTYSMALMMNPREGYADTIRYQLATSYKKLNDCKSAVKVLDEIQKRYPHHPEIDKVIIMAGDCYMDLHAYDKAETNYSNFIRMYPDRRSQVASKLETARRFRRVNLSY